MKGNNKIILIAGICILMNGCSKNNPVNSASAEKEILPLKIGNQWTSYVETKVYFNGDTVNIGFHSYDTMHKAIMYETIIDGKKWYSDSTSDILYANLYDGLYFASTSKGSFMKWIVFKYPCKAGDVFGSFFGTMKVISTIKRVATKAGTFECIQYRTTQQTSSTTIISEYYLSPGVGIIKQTSDERNKNNVPNRYTNEELYRYALM